MARRPATKTEPFCCPGGIDPRHASPQLDPEEALIQAEEERTVTREEEEPRDAALTHEQLLLGLSRLSPTDQALIRAVKLDGKTQDDYAIELGICQAGISYRLTRALKKVRWFVVQEGAWFTPREMRDGLADHLPPLMVAFLTIFWMTGNMCEATELIKSKSNCNGYWLLSMRTLAQIAAEKPELRPYYEALSALKIRGLFLHFRGPDHPKPPSEAARLRIQQSWARRRLGDQTKSSEG